MWTPIYRILSTIIAVLPKRLRFRLWTHLHHRGRRIWHPEGRAQRIEGNMYIKLSSLVRPSEGQVMQFVRRCTNNGIPVPIVVDNVTIDGVTALVLSRLPGRTVIEVRDTLKMDERYSHKLSGQLTSLLFQLRSIPPPSESVCGFGGNSNTPVHCERIAMDAKPRGPWPSVSDFHHYLVTRARLDIPPSKADIVLAQIRLSHSRQHRVCLTHNDLGPQNVLVDDEFNVTGLIDWEAAAWMPEYWLVSLKFISRLFRHASAMLIVLVNAGNTRRRRFCRS